MSYIYRYNKKYIMTILDTFNTSFISIKTMNKTHK